MLLSPVVVLIMVVGEQILYENEGLWFYEKFGGMHFFGTTHIF